ncbi:MAG: trypsin-like peptidase domain-containing protein [Planctomycetota bacterium]|nr:trypsin-like peptidase domain-containing protein [Planctomycetota bacterium]
MARSLVRDRRFATLALLGALFAILWLQRPDHSFSITSIASAAPAAAPAPRQDENPEFIDPSDTFDLNGLQTKFQAIARRVAPSVVAISAAETAFATDDTQRAADMNPKKLEELLDKTTRTVGTGFIIDADGFILTNEHVIEESQQYWVTTDDHKVYPAIVVGADPRADLAVLKIPASHLPVAQFAVSNAPQRGQWAITLGNPYGLATEGEMAMSVGVVSAVDRSLPKLAEKENRLYSNLIQTTAQINPGNSGGPLFDVNGEVIGINTAVILPQKQTNGIGFAIPVTPQLIAEIASLREGREVVYGFLGVAVTLPTPRQRHEANLDDFTGVRIKSIEPTAPAGAQGGLREGDIVWQLNGQCLHDTDQFVRLIGSAPIDAPTDLKVFRDGKPLSISVKPIKRSVQYAVCQENQRFYWRGMVLGPIPANCPVGTDRPATASARRIAGILVIGIDNDSPLRKQGVVAGSVITAVANRPVASMLDLQKVINEVPAGNCDVRLVDSKSKSE